jgi:outer membrane lipoprotein-sorting protein
MAMAQGGKAEALLDKAVSAIKADAGVQMGFTIRMSDASGEEIFDDKGTLKMDGEKYVLLTDGMKLWCDGTTQWSYLAQNNEIYISEPNADDARAFSPVHLMELYKHGFKCTIDSKLSTAKENAVTMTEIARGNDIKRVTVLLDKQNSLPVRLVVSYENGSTANITVDSYKSKCRFTNKEFRCREKSFPGAEVVDMR